MAAGRTYKPELLSLLSIIPSNSDREKFGIYGDAPAVQEWIGDKTYGNLADYDYSIINKNFYTGIGIDRNEIKDDNAGFLTPRIQGMVRAISDFRIDLMITLLIAGTTNLAYDGAAFFSSRAAPNDNLLAGTGITIAQLQTDLAAARSAMLAFETDAGRKFGFAPGIVVVPPALELLMNQAIFSDLAGAGGEKIHNPLGKWFPGGVVAVPELSDEDVNDWYCFNTDFIVKPFVYLDREKPTPVLDDSQVKRNRTLEFSAEIRGNAGYGFFQTAIKTVNT